MGRPSKVTIEERVMPAGRISLRLNYTIGGKRRHESLGLFLEQGSSRSIREKNRETRRLAEAIAAKRTHELFEAPDEIVPTNKRKVTLLTYYATISQFKKNVTWVTLGKHLRTFLNGADPILSSITTQWLESFKAFLLETLSLSNNTAEKYMAHMNTMLKQAFKERLLHRNPYELVQRLRIHDVERVYLTEDELALLFATPCSNEGIRRAFLFACATGLRFSDVSTLTWDKVTDDLLYFRQRKTKSNQYLKLNSTALDLLGPRGAAEELIFRLGNPNYVNKVLIRWAAEAGVAKHVTFHAARHTFARFLISRSGNLLAVKEALGHSRIETTLKYAKLDADALGKVIDLFPDMKMD